MPKIVTPLSDKRIKNLKPKEKDYKVSDGQGLSIFIPVRGNKRWRFDFNLEGRKTISFGVYPEVSLKDAREKRAEAREKIANGEDPTENKNKSKRTNTLHDILREYCYEIKTDWSDAHRTSRYRLVNLNIVPHFKNIDFGDIEPMHMLKAIKKMENRGVIASSRKAFSTINNIYKYGVMVGKCKHNIMADLDPDIVLKKAKGTNFSHVTNKEDLKTILRGIKNYTGSIYTITALKLAPYVFVRPFNIQNAEWGEFDFENKMWNIPAEKMKTGKTHMVPLTDSIIDIIKEVEPFRKGKYLFPSAIRSDRPINKNTMNSAIKRLDLSDSIVTHGFRHTASTLLHENIHVHGIHSDAIEAQLAHAVKGVRGVYNKAIYLEERVRLMQWWSSYLDCLQDEQ